MPSLVTVNSVSQLSQLTRPFLQLDVACTLNAIGYPGKINVLAPTAHPGMHSRAINAYSRSLISAHGGVQVDSLSPWFNFQPFYLADMQKKVEIFTSLNKKKECLNMTQRWTELSPLFLQSCQ